MSKFGSMLTLPRVVLISLALLCIVASHAQTAYDKAWKQVDALVDSLDRPKDALSLVQDLYARARREHNQPQAIRALLYTVRIDQPLLENADSANIHLLETSIDSFPEPSRAILQSLTAQAYWNLLSANRIRIWTRQPVGALPGTDLNTWAQEDFNHRIDSLFSASLENVALLGKTALSDYEPILQKGDSRKLRPTLLDLLAHRAINFYRTLERPEQANPNPILFAPATAFIDHAIPVPDSTANAWKVLHLYQTLLRFHENDAQPEAFADADAGRLEFAHQLSSLDNADDLYQASLYRLVETYRHQDAGAMPAYILAQYLQLRGSNYYTGDIDSTHRWYLVRALRLCDSTSRAFPSTVGGKGARALAVEIRRPELDVTADHVSLPARPILASVGFKNCPVLHLRLLKVTAAVNRAVEGLRFTDLDSITPYRTWTQRLADPGDYRQHRTEIALPALPTGNYILVAATNKLFGRDTLPLHVLPLTVSRIAYIQTGTYSFFVLDRETGEPLPGAQVRLWNTRTGKVEEYVSDDNGHFKWDKKIGLNPSVVRMLIRYGDDSLTVDNGYTLTPTWGGSAPRPAPDVRFAFYTDRSIYRPGQTVFFKAIGMIRDTAEGREVPYHPGKPVPFYLESMGNMLDSLWLEPGEYGSVHGHFVLPSATRTGVYTIKGAESQTNITVEEYKRPTYEVTFTPPSREYRLGDTLTLSGTAAAYAGNPVAGARVSYTVSRYAYYPYRWDRPFAGPIRQTTSKILVQDSTRTGAEGTFSIRLPLQPGEGIRKDLAPTFHYTVNADVTDIDGETHHATYTVQAAYHSLVLTIRLPGNAKINADSLHKLYIRCTNVAGAPRPVLTTVTISRLTPPGRLLHNRLWAAPDVFTLPEDTFHQLFPHDPYGQESDRAGWPVAETVLRDTFTTGTLKAMPVGNLHLSTGVYKVTVSATDPQGGPVSTGGFIEIYNPREARLPYPTYDWNMAGNLHGKDSVTYFTGIGSGPRFVVQQLDVKGHIHLKHLRLKDTVSTLSFPTVENGKGGFSFGLAFIADNRLYTTDVAVAPRTRALSIHYNTFRDKLEPGSTERMTLSVHGPDHEGAEAEVLASMYDASLDQFVPHAWGTPVPLEGTHGPTWRSFGFDVAYGMRPPDFRGYQPPLAPVYDDFLDARGAPGVMITAYGQRVFRIGAGKKMLAPTLATVNVAEDNVEYAAAARPDQAPAAPAAPAPVVTFRNDFSETAFFYPDLHTDDSGHVSFSFTMPEALTRWTLQTLANTRDLDFALDMQTLVTQKTLMVQPNLPRFLREGDDAWLSAKVVNTGDAPLDGMARLEILDALDMQPVQTLGGAQPFALRAGTDTALRFHLAIPAGFTHPLVYRLSAIAGNYSDGEQGPIPVLNRRILLTETYPLHADARVQVTPLLQNIAPYRLTLEYTANPVWYVLRALPYLTGNGNACPQSVADRLYTNTLGAGLVHLLPGIQTLLAGVAIDSSPLYKDAELKNALLEETPWVLDAGKETAAAGRLMAFLDTARLTAGQADALHTLEAQQYPSGAFPWFEGGPESRYSTQYILTRLGRLTAIGMPIPGTGPLVKRALAYLDASIQADAKKHADPTGEDLQYLYARGLFSAFPPDADTKKALDTLLQRAIKGWVGAGLYDQALLVLACNRAEDTTTAGKILTSLEQRSILSPDRGRYWKDNDGGWSWSQAPVETQALLISAFVSAHKDPVFIDQLRTWLLAQKQTQAWATSPATADACYALLLDGQAEVLASPVIDARLGHVKIDVRPGPGLFKQQWEADALTPAMGDIQVRVKDAPHGWGAVYYQYFRDLDSVHSAQTAIAVQKQLFIVRGTALQPLHDRDVVHMGDRIRIRLILRSDRALEFVHLKDLRAACLEPVDVTSGYRFMGGIGYYLSPGDLSTSFFIDWLPKGTSVVEYDQYVNMEGTFSGGIATLESFYAPQFNARSAGVSLQVQR